MIAINIRNIRKILGSFLFGLGAMNLICFVFLDLYWSATGHHVPDVAHGFIYRHQVKSLIAYFPGPWNWLKRCSLDQSSSLSQQDML